MRVRFLFTICLSVFLAINWSFAQNSKAADLDVFWKKFRAAVIEKDKNAVAGMTKFPLAMPFGQKSVRSKAEFLRRYRQIFDGETDAAKCFENAALEIDEANKMYGVYCGFREALDDEDNRPIYYYFEKTKTGWKFAGLDNINE